VLSISTGGWFGSISTGGWVGKSARKSWRGMADCRPFFVSFCNNLLLLIACFSCHVLRQGKSDSAMMRQTKGSRK